MRGNRNEFNDCQQQRGVSMIEILVSLLVLSVGLLGVAALQSFTLQANQGAYFRTQAVNTAYEVTDFIRANRGAPDAIEWDIWQTRIAQELPQGVLTVNIDGNEANVEVTWQEDRVGDEPTGGESVEVTTIL